ncbi:small RNA 2'-O-methyltransferase [Pyxicephalus adspersus]
MHAVRFSPPLSVQRRIFVQDFVSEYKPKKIADLGCRECIVLEKLRNSNFTELLIGVDIDDRILLLNMHRMTPNFDHYLFPLERPLTVMLYHGSVCEKDPALVGLDLISCTELIEHLETEELAKLEDVLFGFWAPYAAIISTPNVEYNVLFTNSPKVRSWEHKFEWTRKEFQDWALKVASRYNYKVEFSGVGDPPPEHKEIGFCSQIATFIKDYNESEGSINAKKQCKSVYEMMLHSLYPSIQQKEYFRKAVWREVRKNMEVLKDRFLYLQNKTEESEQDQMTDASDNSAPSIHHFFMDAFTIEDQCLQDDALKPYMQGNYVYVPLEALLKFPDVTKLCDNLDDIRDVLTDFNILSEDSKAIVYHIETKDEIDEARSLWYRTIYGNDLEEHETVLPLDPDTKTKEHRTIECPIDPDTKIKYEKWDYDDDTPLHITEIDAQLCKCSDSDKKNEVTVDEDWNFDTGVNFVCPINSEDEPKLDWSKFIFS